jgi:hypothetical protein
MTDYNEIKKSITEKFVASGIVCTAGPARLINDEKTKAYHIDAAFAKGTLELKTPYRMGIGLFNENDIHEPAWRGGKQKQLLGNKLTQRYFKPAEIFACVCRDAHDAIEMPVEEYCSEFFGNADSHKGHLAHAECIRYYTVLTNLIGREKLEEFANLYSQL